MRRRKGLPEKMLCLLMTGMILLAALPLPAMAADLPGGVAAITSFDQITIDANTAGANFADAANVIAYLNDNYASVTASTYDGGTVAVPVTSWADTDAYDPAVAGNYTFTAGLGEIPEGYANPADLTPTAEVAVKEASSPPHEEEGIEEQEQEQDDEEGAEVPVPLGIDMMTVTSSVYEITGFDAIADINGGATDAPAYADAAAVIAALPTSVTARVYGGDTISVPVTSWTDTDTYTPAAAGSYTFTAALEIPADYNLGDGVTDTVEVKVVITDPNAAVVDIPDANLKMAICYALKKPSDYIVTVGDMKSLTSLDLSDWGIKDLTGLWAAVNLETLNLSGNPLGADVKETSAYNNIFNGLGNLTGLEYLNVSRCDLGVGNYSSYNIPGSLTSSLASLKNLIAYDASFNRISRSYSFVESILPKLKNISLSGNNLYGVYVSRENVPAIEGIDLTGNYIYFAEGQEGYADLVAIGVDKIDVSGMKNLAALKSVRVANVGGTVSSNYKEYALGEGEYEINAGEIFGNSITFACMAYAAQNSVKVTVNGAPYTAQNDSAAAVPITLSGLPAGENSVTISSMHMSGEDTLEYTLKFNITGVPLGDGSAGIQDAVLQKLVCDKLGKDYTTYVVTIADMALLTGSLSSTEFTNLEGLQYATGLTSLTMGGTFAEYPDLSGLTNLTSLTLRGTRAEAPPGLGTFSKLTSLTITQSALTVVPDLSGLTSLKTLKITYNDNLTGSLPGIQHCTALTTLAITSSPGLAVPEEIAALPLTSLTITFNGLTEIPAFIGKISSLTTLDLGSNSLASLPDLSRLTALRNLKLDRNQFTDVPSAVLQLSGLTVLNMSHNPISSIEFDLSSLQALQQLDLSYCGLTQFPASILELTNLTRLDLNSNKLTSMEGSMEKLSKLADLNIAYNRFDTLPAGIKQLGTLARLTAYHNYLTEIDEDFFENSTKLTRVSLGNYIRCIYENGIFTPLPGSSTESAIARLKQVSPSASVTLVGTYVSDGVVYAGLKKLTTSAGIPEGSFDYHEDGDFVRDLILKVPKDTFGLTVTATAIYDDTVITVGDRTVASGEPFTVDGLVRGHNIIRIDTRNPAGDHTITYNLTIFVGSYTDDTEFPQEGRKYQVQMKAYKENESSLSMADGYMKSTAYFEYKDGQYEVLVTTTRGDYFQDFRYRNAAGTYVDAELVARGATDQSATYRVYVDSLEDDLYINSFVIPMGYAPVFRLLFDTSTIIDITGGEEEPEPLDPDNLPDGQYSVDADAMHETQAGEKSMADQFITENAILTVEDGEITATMVWHRTQLITMNMVEGLWYRDSQGNMTPVPGVPTADTETLTISIPVQSITAPTLFQVYAPQGMGESRPYFKLAFNTGTLTAVGDPSPDKEPAGTIGDGSGTATFGRNALPGTADRTRPVTLNLGDVTINIPLQYLDEHFSNHAGQSLTLQKQEATANSKARVLQIVGSSNTLIGAIDLNLAIGGASVSDLGGRVKITINLTDKQAELLLETSQSSRKLYYYDPDTNTVEDMNAAFDMTAKTVTFYTDHFSTYAIVGATSPSPSDPNGDGPEGDELESGSYTIKVSALMEDSNSYSMVNQFIKERAGLQVYDGGAIDVTMVWYGTTSSPQSSDGIHMTSVKKLQYQNSSGNWTDVRKTLDTVRDTLTIEMTIDSISEPLYMRAQADEMGPEYKVFRLVFKESSLEKGRLESISEDMVIYTIEATAAEGGSISPAGDVDVKEDADQTFTIAAAEGYKIKDVLVNDESVGAVQEYTFEKIEADHTIHAVFETAEAALVEEILPAALNPLHLPTFKDTIGHWAEKPIGFVVSKGFFGGTGNGLFSPNEPMTRGMFVTVLGRMYGVDPEKYTQVSFTDVSADKYYAPYVEWAKANGIAGGVGDGVFAPDKPVTREEAAVILTNYGNLAASFWNHRETAAEPALQEVPYTMAGARLEDGRYTVEAAALKETTDELSMADQMLTEKVTLNVTGGVITAATVMHGTEYITMDMIKELNYQKADGGFAETDRVLNPDSNTLALTFQITDLKKATIMQVYVPEGMGESRPKFRLVLDLETLAKAAAQETAVQHTVAETAAAEFADEEQISAWAKSSVRAMQKAGLIMGDANNRFNPQKPINRAEAAAVLARSMGFNG